MLTGCLGELLGWARHSYPPFFSKEQATPGSWVVNHSSPLAPRTGAAHGAGYRFGRAAGGTAQGGISGRIPGGGGLGEGGSDEESACPPFLSKEQATPGSWVVNQSSPLAPRTGAAHGAGCRFGRAAGGTA